MSQGVRGDCTLLIDLWSSCSYQSDGTVTGSEWQNVNGALTVKASTGAFTFTMPRTPAVGAGANNTCILITCREVNIPAVASQIFTVVDPVAPINTILLTPFPVGTTYSVGSILTVSWTTNLVWQTMRVVVWETNSRGDYFAYSFAVSASSVTNVGGTSSIDMVIPSGLPPSLYYLELAIQELSINSVSTVFRVAGPQSVTVTNPTGLQLTAGSVLPITWTSRGISTNAPIDIVMMNANNLSNPLVAQVCTDERIIIGFGSLSSLQNWSADHSIGISKHWHIHVPDPTGSAC
jgi:hypothetical protein